MEKEKICCEAMKAALRSGTDNEGYQALFYRLRHWRDEIEHPIANALGVGNKLPLPRFCPWCTAEIALWNIGQQEALEVEPCT